MTKEIVWKATLITYYTLPIMLLICILKKIRYFLRFFIILLCKKFSTSIITYLILHLLMISILR